MVVVGIEHKSSSAHTFLIALTSLVYLCVVSKGQRPKPISYCTEEALGTHAQDRLGTSDACYSTICALLNILRSNTDGDGRYIQSIR